MAWRKCWRGVPAWPRSQIRVLTDDVAIVHGSEDDEVEQAGRRFQVRYVYTDIVMKRSGKWQIVASQLAK
jgi:hypothetical protein